MFVSIGSFILFGKLVFSYIGAGIGLKGFNGVCCLSRTDNQFQEFCLQALLECVSSDKPALLHVCIETSSLNGFLS